MFVCAKLLCEEKHEGHIYSAVLLLSLGRCVLSILLVNILCTAYSSPIDLEHNAALLIMNGRPAS